MADDDLVELGKRELEQLGLVDAADVEAGYVVRMPKAYPIYDDAYKANVERHARRGSSRARPNVHPVGRNGMHRTTTRTTRCSRRCSPSRTSYGADHDIWAVNVEEEYHEEKAPAIGATDHEGIDDKGTGRAAPVIPARPSVPTIP